jgi:hypothetical protein
MSRLFPSAVQSVGLPGGGRPRWPSAAGSSGLEVSKGEIALPGAPGNAIDCSYGMDVARGGAVAYARVFAVWGWRALEQWPLNSMPVAVSFHYLNVPGLTW